MPISVLLFLGIIFVLVYCLRRAKIGALVAFLFTGILSGPYVFNLFELTDTWSFLGDMGILFLWFTIGLEINIRRLWNMRRTRFGFGLAQVMMVAIMLFPLLFGITTWTMMGCIMVALMLAMSSTSSALDLLTDRNQLNTTMGRQTFSILLFQDLLSIPLLAMLPVFAGKTFNLGASAIDVFVISVALIVGVVVLGRFVMTPLLSMVAKLKSKEAFLLAVMLNIVIWAVLLDLMGLPAGLGAFMAGMLMSETVYRHQIDAQISPYASMFLAFFFITLGMGFNLPMLFTNWYIIVAGVVGLIAVKFLAIFVVARVRRVPISDAMMIALILAQGGEFGLLMLQTMRTSGISAIPPQHQEILSAIIVLSIMMTPILLAIYDKMWRAGRLPAQRRTRDLENDVPDIKPQVIICGFGRVGQIVAQMLSARKVPYIAIDLDVSTVMMARENGFNVVYGDTSNADILREFGLKPRSIRAVVVALDNAHSARQTVLMIKSIAPRVPVFARARNLADLRALLREGVAYAMPETIESSLFLGRNVLSHLGVSENKIRSLLEEMRSDNYKHMDSQITDKQE